jgi:hypothetical protein
MALRELLSRNKPPASEKSSDLDLDQKSIQNHHDNTTADTSSAEGVNAQDDEHQYPSKLNLFLSS